MNINKKYIGILSIATTILLNACSSDGSGAQENTSGNPPANEKMRVMAFSSPFADAVTTDVTAPTGFTAYTPNKRTTMGVYMLLSENPATDWATPEEKSITYSDRWHAFFDVTADKTYTVYGYMPKTEGMTSTLTKSTADAATLAIEGIKPVTTDDVCIITGVEDANVGLKEGQFSWYTPVGADTYYINILMDHLYAAVMVSMKIDAEYANLRTIKVKQMELSTDKGSVKATISLTHNDTGASPVTGVTYTPSGSSCTAEIFNSEEGSALDKTTPLVINACFAPTLSNNLTLVTTYDVYDSKGNLIRQNCTATNKLPNLEAVRAQRVQVNMTVNPTYLYVLSEPDLDNPTIEVE